MGAEIFIPFVFGTIIGAALVALAHGRRAALIRDIVRQCDRCACLLMLVNNDNARLNAGERYNAALKAKELIGQYRERAA